MRVDHRQWLVEQDRRHVVAHQPPAHGNLLLFVGSQVAGALVQQRVQLQYLGNFVDLGEDLRLIHALITQGEGQVVEHRHGVVDHRKLENLGDIALLGRQRVDHLAIKLHFAVRRAEQPGNDIQQGRLAAAGWPQQRIGAALLPHMIHLANGVIGRASRRATVTVGQIEQTDLGHQATLPRRRLGA